MGRPIGIEADDLTAIIDPQGLSEGRTRHIDRREGAPVQEKAVFVASDIEIDANDLTAVINPRGLSEGRTWHIDRTIFTFCSPLLRFVK